MRRVVAAVALMLATLRPGPDAHAMQGCGGDCTSCHQLTLKEANSILKGMGNVRRVRTSAVRGLWQLDFEKDGKTAIVYMDYGKKYVIPGPVFDIATRSPIAEVVNGSATPSKIRVSLIPLKNSIVIGNPAGTKRLFVFTDPDCPYCYKLHLELKKLVQVDREVAVYIKLFPLKMHPKAYDKSRAIMSGNSKKLLEDAFNGAKFATLPLGAGSGVDETIKLAQSLGIHSTPTLVFPDGRVMTGFRSAEDIRQLLTAKRK